MNIENEIWKNIKDFPDYCVSNFGRIKSLKFGKEKIRKCCKSKDGYLRINLSKNGKLIAKKIHILVYETFNKKLNNMCCVHHLDENKNNNYLKNLKKITKKEHRQIHMIGSNNPNFGKDMSGKNNPMFGIKKFGEKSSNHKLVSQDVIQIKFLLKEGKLTQQEIADIFEIKQVTISDIKRGKNWSHIEV